MQQAPNKLRTNSDRLDELEAVIGYPALRRLVLRYGGGRVSSVYRSDSELALVLRDAYRAFCSHFAGGSPRIPLHLDRHRAKDALRAAVVRDAQTADVDEIAPRYAISDRTVYRILAQHRSQSRR